MLGTTLPLAPMSRAPSAMTAPVAALTPSIPSIRLTVLAGMFCGAGCPLLSSLGLAVTWTSM